MTTPSISVVTLVVGDDDNILFQFKPISVGEGDNVLAKMRENAAEIAYELMRFFLNRKSQELASIKHAQEKEEAND